MDPASIKALAEIVGPFLAITAMGAIPVALVFLNKHFKLRTRELELEAELHGRDSVARMQALETRLSAMEGALGSLVNVISRTQDRTQDLMQPPDAPHATLESQRSAALTQVK